MVPPVPDLWASSAPHAVQHILTLLPAPPVSRLLQAMVEAVGVVVGVVVGVIRKCSGC